MSTRISLIAVCAMLALAGLGASAGTIDLGGGWRANWPPPHGSIGIHVDEVTPDYIAIQISKDFTEPPVNGVFPARVIDFVQIAPDPNTVPRIIIRDETVTNLTGADWTDYHWLVFDQGDAWFNVPMSASFDTSPFVNKAFSDPHNVFGDPNKATDLDAYGGLVPSGQTFFPGHVAGDLVIDVDLTRPGPLSFTFKQIPTPEPGSLLLLGLAGAVALRRRA